MIVFLPMPCFSSPILIGVLKSALPLTVTAPHGKSLFWIAVIAVGMIHIELELLKENCIYILNLSFLQVKLISFPSSLVFKVSVHVIIFFL